MQLRTIIVFIIAFHFSIFAQPNQTIGEENSINNTVTSSGKHFLDLGTGLGLDYGGIVGVKLAYILPIPNLSVFGAAGFELVGFGWNAGITIHILPETDKYLYRPNVKIMYGTNGATIVIGKDEYNKVYNGFTPGIGSEFMFGSKRANGFDVDLNFPIHGQDFKDQVDKMKNDPDIISKPLVLPFAFSIGYHHEF